MAGASYVHNRIVANLLGVLRDVLAESSCRALPSDMKIHVPSREGFVYPDASIVCGAPQFYDEAADVLVNPASVFEVLSESTERFDRGEKFFGYRSIPSLRECLLISQQAPHVEHYARRPDGTWVLADQIAGGMVSLAVGGKFLLDRLYEDTSP